MYLKSALAKSFQRVEVEAFSPGSIVVDYYLVFKELPEGRKVTTQDLKDIVDVETKQKDSKNMLGELRIDPTYSDFIGESEWMITVEPNTNTVVLVVSTDDSPPPPEPQSEDFLPPWAVAVIVIGLASVAFVIVFGVSMVSIVIISMDVSLTHHMFQLYKKRKIMQGRGKSGKQALNLTEEMVRTDRMV